MIIGQIEHIKKYTDTRLAANFHSLKPLISVAARKYILPVIPVALYNNLNALPEPPEADNEIRSQLLFALREAMANLILALYVPRGEAFIGANGIQRNEGDNDKSAFKYQSAAVERSYRSAGIDAFDHFLLLLEKNASNIIEWQDSVEQIQYRDLLIKSGTELNNIYTLRHPQLVYMAIRSDIRDVEQLTIADTFGVTLDGIKSRTISDSATLDDAIILSLIKKATAHLSLHRAIPKLNVSLDDGSLTMYSDELSYSDKGKNSADKLSVSNLSDHLKNTGNEYLSRAVRYLDEHASDVKYPEWYASMNSNTGSIHYDNDQLNGVFSL